MIWITALLIALGSIHRDRREWDEAQGFYQQALALDPDNPEAHQQYGEWLHKTGRVAEAVRSMDRASILDPAPVRLWQLLLTLRTDGRWDEVQELLAWVETEGLHEHFEALGRAVRSWERERAVEEGRFEDAAQIAFDPPVLPRDTLGLGAVMAALQAGRTDMLPDSVAVDSLWPEALLRLNKPDMAVEALVDGLRENRLIPDRVWRPPYDSLRTSPRVRAYLDSIGLGGLTVQRTPVEERVRPAILRQADASAAAIEIGSAP